jgi:hypothetical protein
MGRPPGGGEEGTRMKREMFFASLGIVGVLFGVGFLLLPEMSLRMYGVPTDPHNLMQSRYFGSALLGLGLIAYLARDTQDPKAIRALLLGSLVSDAAGAVISASAAGSLQNGMAWLSVAIYAAFAAGAGYYLLVARERVEIRSA